MREYGNQYKGKEFQYRDQIAVRNGGTWKKIRRSYKRGERGTVKRSLRGRIDR